MQYLLLKKIVAAFRGMHVSPAKHSFGKCDRRTDRRTDDGQSDPYVSLCFAGDTKKMCVCETQMPQRQQSPKLNILSIMVMVKVTRSLTLMSIEIMVKVTRSLTLMSIERVSLVEYACQI